MPSILVLSIFAAAVFLIFLPALEHSYRHHRKYVARDFVNVAVGMLERFKLEADLGRISESRAKHLGEEQLRAMRYGDERKDYIWINDLNSVMVMHPYRSDLEGKDLSDYTDSTGKAIFNEFISTALQGGGFVQYYWQFKDKPGAESRKTSYVRLYEPWGWVVGSGVYMADVQAQINQFRNRTFAGFGLLLLIVFLLQAYILRQAALSEQRAQRIKTQRERLFLALKEGEERYRTIADFAYDWEAWVGPDKTILYSSPACERITGHPPERFFENPTLMRDIVIPEDRKAWDTYAREMDRRESGTLDFRIRTSHGEERWVGAVARRVSGIKGKPLGVRYSFRDITDGKAMEEQLRHQALHDPLTALANRTLCLDRIEQAMHRAKRRESYYFAVAFLDLDRFKIINDSLGHRFGDLVLMETGNRLKSHVRSLDTVSRFGGDEFVLLLDELASPGEAISIVKRIRQSLSQPFRFGNHEVQTTGSFGIVLSPTGSDRPEDVLQHANIAMHRAKEAGRNHFKVFTTRMLDHAVDQLNLENDMRRGLAHGAFHVRYQPIMDISSNRVLGFEALARWDHPTRGSIPPSEFIPMAEDSGQISDLGRWVLRQSLKDLAEWRKQSDDTHHLFVSVNLSSKQFAQPDLDRSVLALLEEFGLPPSALKLEITESAIMDNPEAAVRVLKRLRSAGIGFSIDDFGTGYSSLSQLRQLPVDTLKVDRSFISRMNTDPENMEIVKAVIALAHSLDLNVIAEGVEDRDQLCSLLDLRCESVQGFYFHRPLTKQDAEAILFGRKAAEDAAQTQQTVAKKESPQEASDSDPIES